MSALRAPIRLLVNAGRALRLAANRRLLGTADRGVWLVLRVGTDTAEQRTTALPFGLGGENEEHLGLLDALRVLESAADDRRVAGVLLRFHGHLPGWSKALALRRSVDALRESGVKVAVWAESLAAEDYLVASAADVVWLPPAGSLFLVGLRTEQFFLRGLLSHLDIEPEVVRIGTFKGAGELLTRDAMSPEQREQLDAWLDDLYGDLVGAIARGRGLEPDAVRERIDDGPYPVELAIERGLVDEALYPDEVEERIKSWQNAAQTTPSGSPRERIVEGAEYHRVVARDPGWRPLGSDLPRIAYVVASGSIQRGAGMRGITSDGFRRMLAGLEKEASVRGVVIRVDSPGGDAIASDLLFRAVKQLARAKPVVVSMAEVAASGGYYLAAAADAVFAESGTLTGSIGVVGGKLNFGGLYRKLGIGKDSVERGARAGLLSESRAFSPDERNAVRREMEALYETFVGRVAEGRNLPVAAVKKVAGGRVWSGLRARHHGLVDAIGGPLEALTDARRRAGLAEGDRFQIELHPRRARLPGIRAILGVAARAVFRL
jgi:protease-4